MYFYDNKKHSIPHIHAEYAEHAASISIEDGEVLNLCVEYVRYG